MKIPSNLLSTVLVSAVAVAQVDGQQSSIDSTSCTLPSQDDDSVDGPPIMPCTDNEVDSLTVGPDSCIGNNACVANRASSLSIGSGSCTSDSICTLNNYTGGSISIGSGSCLTGVICGGNQGETLTIGNDACTDSLSCNSNKGATVTIGDQSCVGSAACWDNANILSVGTSACIGPTEGGGVCSRNFGRVSVGNSACVGASSCQSLGEFPPTDGSVSISDFSSDNFVDILGNACVGDNTCASIAGSSWMIGQGSCVCTSCCLGMTSPRGQVLTGACTGENSCLTVAGAVLTIGENSCSGESSCQGLTPGFLLSSDVPRDAQGLNYSVSIGSGSCTGKSSCYSDLNRDVVIGNNACTDENSCRNCLADVPDGAQDCNSGSAGAHIGYAHPVFSPLLVCYCITAAFLW